MNPAPQTYSHAPRGMNPVPRKALVQPYGMNPKRRGIHPKPQKNHPKPRKTHPVARGMNPKPRGIRRFSLMEAVLAQNPPVERVSGPIDREQHRQPPLFETTGTGRPRHAPANALLFRHETAPPRRRRDQKNNPERRDCRRSSRGPPREALHAKRKSPRCDPPGKMRASRLREARGGPRALRRRLAPLSSIAAFGIISRPAVLTLRPRRLPAVRDERATPVRPPPFSRRTDNSALPPPTPDTLRYPSYNRGNSGADPDASFVLR